MLVLVAAGGPDVFFLGGGNLGFEDGDKSRGEVLRRRQGGKQAPLGGRYGDAARVHEGHEGEQVCPGGLRDDFHGGEAQAAGAVALFGERRRPGGVYRRRGKGKGPGAQAFVRAEDGEHGPRPSLEGDEQMVARDVSYKAHGSYELRVTSYELEKFVNERLMACMSAGVREWAEMQALAGEGRREGWEVWESRSQERQA